MPVVEVFRALGDPTRLEMVQRLSDGQAHTITSVSTGLDISRQGARKHLQVLADAKVISIQPKGRDMAVSLQRDTLEQSRAFITELELQWDQRLESLRQFVDIEQR